MASKIYDILVYSNGPKAYAPRRILEEAQKLKLKADVIQFRNITLNFNSKDRLPETKALFIRGMGEDVNHLPLKYLLMDYYSDKAKIINGKSFNKWMSLDKVTQHIEYQKNGIPFAKSYYFGSKDLALEAVKKFEFPKIVKFNAGSKGMSVFKLKKASDLKKILDDGYDIRTLLFQDFMPNAVDLRVIVLDGKVLGAMKRIAKKGQYLTNFSQGGSVEVYDIEKDKQASDIALKVAKVFKLDYCGVDLMKNNEGNWIVLEVNRACQFQGFELSTGINVARKIIDYVNK